MSKDKRAAKKEREDAGFNHDVATRQVAFNERNKISKEGKVGKDFSDKMKKKQRKTAKKAREANREAKATQWHN